MSIIIPAVVSFLMLVADQITKMAVVSYFGDSGKTVPVIKGRKSSTREKIYKGLQSAK